MQPSAVCTADEHCLCAQVLRCVAATAHDMGFQSEGRLASRASRNRTHLDGYALSGDGVCAGGQRLWEGSIEQVGQQCEAVVAFWRRPVDLLLRRVRDVVLCNEQQVVLVSFCTTWLSGALELLG